ncbi:MAG: hypothetical protein H0W62_05400 [Chitinophagales bacterium]|nr:hypothetical protein [Chitinophagales bacterium]
MYSNTTKEQYDAITRNVAELKDKLNSSFPTWVWHVASIVQIENNGYTGSYIEWHSPEGIIQSDDFDLRNTVDLEEKMIEGIESCIQKAIKTENKNKLQEALDKYETRNGDETFLNM